MAVLLGIPERRLLGLEDRKQPLVHSFAGRQLPPIGCHPLSSLAHPKPDVADATDLALPLRRQRDGIGRRIATAIPATGAGSIPCRWPRQLPPQIMPFSGPLRYS